MFDYIVVGAGAAGCVVASRLSEEPAARVLLLEAGGEDAAREVRIPAAFAKLFRGPADWAYETDAEPNMAGRRMYWPRGRMIGGTSSMNAMLYMRGNRRDYDAWAAAGCNGWGWSDVLPFFLRSEHNERGASEYHGVGGPLNVADQRDPNPVSHAALDALVAAGVPRNADFNGAEQDGTGFYQVTQKNGARWSTADAFLRPALRRPNLTVRTGAQATRVLFERARATGVEFRASGRLHQARGEEVILCGGAINSPQLLMLSGIGPADALRALGIDVVADLPGIGENLQDHLAAGVMLACRRPCTLAAAESIPNLTRFIVRRRGPLTSPVAEVGAFVRSRGGLDAPDLQLLFAPAYFADHGFGNPPGHGFTLAFALLRPASRGRITLRSTSPFDPPAIEAKYLTESSDLETMLEGQRIAREAIAARPLDEFRGDEFLPGAGILDRAGLTASLAQHAQTLYHPVGTCRMGHDERAAVDDELRVRGVERLRVIDASIMPSIVGGNTHAPTVMIAEKGADLVRGRAGAARATRAAMTELESARGV